MRTKDAYSIVRQLLVAFVPRITGRKRVPSALKEPEQYARCIITSSLDMIVTTDDERRIVEFNRAAEETFGYTRGEVIGKSVSLLYANPQESQTVHQTAVNDGRFVGEISNKRKNGEVFTSFLSAAVLKDAKGRRLGIVGVSRDITEHKRAEEKLRYLSMHDTLTGLYNRAYFEEEMAGLERGRTFPMSVVVADVDGLKRVNDNAGHATGDALLKCAARVLSLSFRAEDVAARVGGDEFGVLLIGADSTIAAEALERIRRNLTEQNTSQDGIPLSLSIGVATTKEGMSLAQTLKQADARMYTNKLSHATHSLTEDPQEETVGDH